MDRYRTCKSFYIILISIYVSLDTYASCCPIGFYYDCRTKTCTNCSEICDNAKIKGTEDKCDRNCRYIWSTPKRSHVKDITTKKHASKWEQIFNIPSPIPVQHTEASTTSPITTSNHESTTSIPMTINKAVSKKQASKWEQIFNIPSPIPVQHTEATTTSPNTTSNHESTTSVSMTINKAVPKKQASKWKQTINIPSPIPVQHTEATTTSPKPTTSHKSTTSVSMATTSNDILIRVEVLSLTVIFVGVSLLWGYCIAKHCSKKKTTMCGMVHFV
ncbi:hypothetical protein ACF0H5_000626 [Mactra antiquata]